MATAVQSSAVRAVRRLLRLMARTAQTSSRGAKRLRRRLAPRDGASSDFPVHSSLAADRNSVEIETRLRVLKRVGIVNFPDCLIVVGRLGSERPTSRDAVPPPGFVRPANGFEDDHRGRIITGGDIG